GDGTFLPAVTYNVGAGFIESGAIPSGAISVAVGDFNNDGKLDIVTANQFDNTVSVFSGRGDGTFLPATSFHVPTGPTIGFGGGGGGGGGAISIAVADFNHDGNLDIVTANPAQNTVTVY